MEAIINTSSTGKYGHENQGCSTRQFLIAAGASAALVLGSSNALFNCEGSDSTVNKTAGAHPKDKISNQRNKINEGFWSMGSGAAAQVSNSILASADIIVQVAFTPEVTQG